MPTIQNARAHDLVVGGVTLTPGGNAVSDEQLVAVAKDPQFRVWQGLGWVGIVQYSEDDLRKVQEEARAKEAEAAIAREKAAAETAKAERDVMVVQRENALDKAVREAEQRLAQKRAHGDQQQATAPAGQPQAQPPGTLHTTKTETSPMVSGTTPPTTSGAPTGTQASGAPVEGQSNQASVEGALKGSEVGSPSAQAEARGDVHAKNEAAARDAKKK